ncbi:hypothetical protein KP509_1Z029800 [Ceratopteris richardii]|nr:hypothetical protein KP509_1Z029800 [Ceratopteris richardii]
MCRERMMPHLRSCSLLRKAVELIKASYTELYFTMLTRDEMCLC